jgi:V/A-type H+-transporting ATPase subunit I
MSIVPLVKVTVYGHQRDKEQVLDDLQTMGCLHIVPLRSGGETLHEAEPSSRSREALAFLMSSSQWRRQIRDAAKFDAVAVEQRALDLKDQILTLEDERDFLRRRIADLQPWGELRFPPLDARHNLRLWFYIVPHREMPQVEDTELVWEVVGRDYRFVYVVVLSEEEPQGMPVARTHTGSKPLSELERRLDEVETESEDLQAERTSLTRWCTLFAQSLDQLEDRAARLRAAAQTFDDDLLFALQAWAPQEKVSQLQNYTGANRLALEVQEPAMGDTPPTLFRNVPALAGGEDLVTFYQTPSYWLWDPSTVVLFSFAIFFAMIMSDAGYALLLGIVLVFAWRRLGASETGRRIRVVFAVLVGASLIWGVWVGSYFGLTPSRDTLLGTLKFIDLNDFSTMMRISIMVGVAHVALGNIMNAWRFGRDSAALAPLGWVLVLLSGLFLWLGAASSGVVETIGTVGIGLGLLAVVLFTNPYARLGTRLLSGLLRLTNLTNAFGDVLSYLRLFALGLASASLALTFNDLASQVAEALPGVGVLFAIAIVLVGHSINLALAIVSGFVHGLRLNMIEFFRWGLPEEGETFRAFARKEQSTWSPGSSS